MDDHSQPAAGTATRDETQPMIQFDSVSLRYPKSSSNTVEDITFSVRPEETVSLIGPSGCGKSTLLRLAAGLISPTDGYVSQSETIRAPGKSAFVFQDPRLLGWRTVVENVRLPLELTRSEINRDQIVQTLLSVGLVKDDFQKRPYELSGGMRMRVALARALITDPKFLLLDEPFAALDEILRQQMNELLLKLCDERKCTVLFVTHNVSESLFLSDNVLMMGGTPGRILQTVFVEAPTTRNEQWRLSAGFLDQCRNVSHQLRGAMT